MTLDYILNAAVASMVQGHHVPHCFKAWVDGDVIHNRAEYYLAQLQRTAEQEVANMGYATAYAEPGYAQPTKGILFANWNYLPRDFDKVLERAGYAVEWSDEWATCDGCNNAVRTSPDSYCWTPSYVLDDDGVYCLACAGTEEVG